MRTLERNMNLGLLILRLSIGILMLFHGISKLVYGAGFIEQVVTDAGLPAFIAYGVYLGEVIAPLFIIGGYRTRIAALVLAGNCIVAASLVHLHDLLSLNDQGGWAVELLGLYFFGTLVLIFTGGGKYAISNKHFWD